MYHRFLHALTVLAAATLIGVAAPARIAHAFAIFTVGGDAACGFDNIQDALDAAHDSPGEDYVWIAGNASYTGQQLLVHDQDVDIEGGFVDCNDFDIDVAQTTVSGSGNNGWAVFSIDGTSHVYLSNLFITGADRDGGASGGGIYFGGAGALTLQLVTIGANHAGYGAGMNVTASGGPVTVTLLHDTLLVNNTAEVSGGGIRIEGDTRLYALADNTSFILNSAVTGYGGALEILSGARADIGSPGYNGLAVIYGNDAKDGGGIAVYGGNNASSYLRMFTTDPLRPTRLDGNIANGRGGAIYTNSMDYQGVACLYDFAATGNVAEDGAAFYADEGLAFYINDSADFDPNCGAEPIAALGAQACIPGAGCNDITGSATQHSDGSPSAGAIIKIGQFSKLFGNRFRMTDNLGAWMIRADDSLANTMSNCLIANNGVSTEVISGVTDSEMHINSCTLANNLPDGGYVLGNDYYLTVSDSIITEPGYQAIDFTGPGNLLLVDHTLASDISTLNGSTTSVQGEATYVDPAGRNYHLKPQSIGVDFAPAAADVDLDGNTRDVDLPGYPNVFGPLDLGAYETQSLCGGADTIFCAGFE
jgi:predicted outer membrane repeat protein